MEKRSLIELLGVPAKAAHLNADSRARIDPGVGVSCPLGRSANIVLVERIRTRHLVTMANKMLAWDTSPEFGNVKEIGFYRCGDCDLQFFHPAVTGSERFYKQFQKFDWYYKKNKEEYDFARQFVRPADSVLEIGCGRGAFSKQIPAKNYLGLEFSEDAIQAAADDGVLVKKGPIDSHAFCNRDKYDFVCAFHVLEHVAEPYSFIESSLACVKPGGLLVYSVPSDDSFLAIGRNSVTNLPPHHVTRWSDRCLRNLAAIFGMTLVALEHHKMGDHHKRAYASCIILDSLESLIGEQRRLVNRTLRHRFLAKIANIGALLLQNGLRGPWVVPRGPSVTVVYQKV